MKKKNNTLNYIIWFLIVLIIVIGAWIIVGKVNLGKEAAPYTIYNGYVIYEIRDDKSLRYNVEAYANDGMKYIHIFKYYPTDLLDLDYDKELRSILYKDISGSLKKDKIYLSYDPAVSGEELLSAGTLVQILGTGDAGIFKIPVVISVTEDNGNPDFPIKTCEDASGEIGVILLKYGEPKIYKDRDCIIIQGNNADDFKKLDDLLSYILLGVIPDENE
jgi:hypothetical protein